MNETFHNKALTETVVSVSFSCELNLLNISTVTLHIPEDSLHISCYTFPTARAPFEVMAVMVCWSCLCEGRTVVMLE